MCCSACLRCPGGSGGSYRCELRSMLNYVAKIAPRPLAAWRAGPAGTAADYRREVAFDGEDLIV